MRYVPFEFAGMVLLLAKSSKYVADESIYLYPVDGTASPFDLT